MKKNRAFHRQLKRELKELRRDNEAKKRVIEIIKSHMGEYKDKYNTLRNRARLFSNEFTVLESDMFQMKRVGMKPDVQLIESMTRQLMSNPEFYKMFHIEQMTSDLRNPEILFRYKVSLEALEPTSKPIHEYGNLIK